MVAGIGRGPGCRSIATRSPAIRCSRRRGRPGRRRRSRCRRRAPACCRSSICRQRQRPGLLRKAEIRSDGHLSQRYPQYAYTVSASQPLYRPQNNDRLDQAKQQVGQADYVLASAQQDLILRVTRRISTCCSRDSTSSWPRARRRRSARSLRRRSATSRSAPQRSPTPTMPRRSTTRSSPGDPGAKRSRQQARGAARHHRPHAEGAEARRARSSSPSCRSPTRSSRGSKGHSTKITRCASRKPTTTSPRWRSTGSARALSDARSGRELQPELRRVPRRRPTSRANSPAITRLGMIGVQLNVPIYQGGSSIRACARRSPIRTRRGRTSRPRGAARSSWRRRLFGRHQRGRAGQGVRAGARFGAGVLRFEQARPGSRRAHESRRAEPAAERVPDAVQPGAVLLQLPHRRAAAQAGGRNADRRGPRAAQPRSGGPELPELRRSPRQLRRSHAHSRSRGAAMRRMERARGAAHRLRRSGSASSSATARDQPSASATRSAAPAAMRCAVASAKVERVRTDERRHAERDRLDQVLSAERAAGCRRRTRRRPPRIVRGQLAHRIAEHDVDIAGHGAHFRCAGRSGTPRPAQELGDGVEALRMARHDDGQRARGSGARASASSISASSPSRVLAATIPGAPRRSAAASSRRAPARCRARRRRT